MTRGLVLAGTHSGCGKTSVTLGLLRALARRGLAAQPFKAGPDFIDPGLHAVAAGRPSHNLDTWMMPPDAVRGVFRRHACGADLALVEGVMGLFDGYGGTREQGSTAHLAKTLDLPVVLVVDAASQAASVAALVRGFARFDPGQRLAGVVLNRVGSDRHEAILRQALAAAADAPVLGCLRRAAPDEPLGLQSRHLGLVTADDAAGLEHSLEALADWVERGVDIPALLARLPELAPATAPAAPATFGAGPLIGVARDRAFCFLYHENLRLLEAAGARLAFFSPLADARLPAGADGELDGLYLPGGYPELAARELAANAPMREAVRGFCASGRPVWAECGGYMYLMRSLADAEGAEHPMCGVLPLRAALRTRRAALGYRDGRTLADGPLGPAGTLLRGHEFHYSEARQDADAPAFAPAFELVGSDGAGARDGLAGGNVVGGYFHAHLSSNPDAAAAFVAACRAASAGPRHQE